LAVVVGFPTAEVVEVRHMVAAVVDPMAVAGAGKLRVQLCRIIGRSL
jgi:hypothetical protein